MEENTINIIADESHLRLDQFLVSKYPELSRSKIQFLIKNQHILVDGLSVKPSFKLNGGEEISGAIIEIVNDAILPQKLDLDVIYEDNDLIAINKNPGMIVHPGNGNYKNTIVNGLMYHFNKLSNKNTLRPGIIHRLDKETSGVLLVAKNNFTHDFISTQFANREIYKEYEAIVWGKVEKQGTVECLIGRNKKNRILFSIVQENGKFSKSDYFLNEFINPLSFVKLVPYTGRTHQLRVHMKSIGHPIFGDVVYNGGPANIKAFDDKYSKKLEIAYKNLNRVALHAKTIKFILPSNKKEMVLTVDTPNDMNELISVLQDNEN